MCVQMRTLSFLTMFCFLSTGCSLAIQPDKDRLGPNAVSDAGPDSSLDLSLDLGVDTAVDATPDRNIPPDVTRPDNTVDAVPQCTSEARCEGDKTLVLCQDGVETAQPCDYACQENRCVTIVPSNVRPELVNQTMGNLFVPNAFNNNDNFVRVDTENCVILAENNNIRGLLEMQVDGSRICVISLDTLEVDNGGGLVAFGPHPLALLSPNTIDIRGFISASGVAGAPGPGGSEGGNRRNSQGTGSEPGAAGQHQGQFNDGGGGGGGFCGRGGDGGDGENARGGEGGNGIGNIDLSPLRGGSGGGAGEGFTTNQQTNRGLGGASGGGLQLFSPVEIRVTGALFASGGSGSASTRPIRNFNAGSGGGGGSGGGILIETPILSGQGFVSVAGGAGGGGYGEGGRGENGQEGFEGDPVPQGGSGGPVHGGRGGDGAGGMNVRGTDGEDVFDRRTRVGNGGGGGGGGGCVVVRSNQSAPLDFSPGAAVNQLSPRVQ